MGNMSRRKGASGEREFAELLSAAFGVTIKRKLGAARDGGDDVAHCNYSFEVKRQETVKIEQWMRQALANAAANPSNPCTPVVVFRRNGGRWRACMDLDHFFALLKKAHPGEISLGIKQD